MMGRPVWGQPQHTRVPSTAGLRFNDLAAHAASATHGEAPCAPQGGSLDLLRGEAIFHEISDMTRSDLVEELAARFSQLTYRDAELAVKTVLDAMSEALVQGHRIEIRGFGSFSVTRRPPRIGRNPRSGQAVMVPEKRIPHFKPGKALRQAVDTAPLANTPTQIAQPIE